MKKWVKITIGIFGVIVLLFVIDIICIFTIDRPLFAIQNDGGNVYRGIFYDTYNCREYSIPQIKRKGLKLACSDVKLNIGDVVSIKDTSLNKSCAEVMEGFYEDDNYSYYFDCAKSKYIIVEYENGFKESVKDALKYGTITIDEIDRYNIKYYKYEKENNDYKLVSSLSNKNNVNVNILVRFNNKLYAKSNSIIDYAGGSKQIGVIDKVIDSKYIPKLNNETNTLEILNAKVYDETGSSIVLEYDNEYVLFEKIDGEYELTFDMAMNCYAKVYEFKDGTSVYSSYSDIKYKTSDKEISIKEALDNKKLIYLI